MRNILAVFSAKMARFFIQILGFGAGATWPGEIALRINPRILSFFPGQLRRGVVLVAGTNGKTTTALMLVRIFETAGYKVIHNASGANLDNGIASAFLEKADLSGKINADLGILEIDENSLPRVLPDLKKVKGVVLLNLFRDQLDRYGEVDVIAEKWRKALKRLPDKPIFVLNSDDPQIAYLGRDLKPGEVIYFGVNQPKLFIKGREHAADSTFCLNCGHRLNYIGVYYSHIGIWHCPNCGEKRPEPSVTKWNQVLPGLYNLYNTLAAAGLAEAFGIEKQVVEESLKDFKPAFGRQEEFDFEGKKIKIFLSKNPAGFNASLRTVIEFKPKVMLLVLNDRIPDGRDVSWIWDVDYEKIAPGTKIFVSGERVFDLALRLKYAGKKNLIIKPDLKAAIKAAARQISSKEILYILPTYSAMLEVRKIVGGRKIL